MARTEDKYVVALDIGTSKVCVLVGEVNDRGQLEIIGKGTAPMKGTRRGNIINLDQAIDAVKKAGSIARSRARISIASSKHRNRSTSPRSSNCCMSSRVSSSSTGRTGFTIRSA